MSSGENQEIQTSLASAVLTEATIHRMVAEDIPVGTPMSDPRVQAILVEVSQVVNEWQYWLVQKAFPAWPDPGPSRPPSP